MRHGIKDEDDWLVQFSPRDISELAVPKMKVNEAINWFGDWGRHNEKVLIIIGPPGSGKSTMIKLIAKKLSIEIKEWIEPNSKQTFARFVKNNERSFEPEEEEIIEFLEQSKYKGLLKTIPRPNLLCEHLVLLDDLPQFHENSVSKRKKIFEIIKDFSEESTHPIVLIIGSISDNQATSQNMEKMLGRDLAQSGTVHVIKLNPIVKLQISKLIDRVISEKNILISDESKSCIVEDSYGDIRNALLSLQLYSLNKTCHPLNYEAIRMKNNQNLSIFHAIGKILYAKRMEDSSKANKRKGTNSLSYDPDDVLLKSGLDASTAEAFLQFHCVDFFSEIDELERALSAFSEADLYISAKFSTGLINLDRGNDDSFLDDYANYFSSRAVSTYKKTPAPYKMKKFGAPPALLLHRKISEEKARALKKLNEGLVFGSKRACDSIFADVLPYIRSMTGLSDSCDAITRYTEIYQEKELQTILKREKF